MKTIKLLGCAITGWIVGILVLFGLSWKLSKPETTSNALLWAIEYWWVAFAFGLLILLVAAAVTKSSPVRALMAYAVPVALLSALAGICLLVYPNAGFREELLGSLPVAVVFYVFGCIWATMRKGTGGDVTRVMLPPLAGGFLILSLVAFPVFMGNAFRYRNAFDLQVIKIDRPKGQMIASCVLEISKPGNYEFTAPPSYMMEPMYVEDAEPVAPETGKINWGAAGQPRAGATGKFPLEIRWEKLPEMPAEFAADPLMFETQIMLEARPADEPDKVLFTVSGDTPDGGVN